MSQSTLKNRKGASAQPSAAEVVSAADYVPMEAQSRDELYSTQGAVPTTNRGWTLMSITGKHRLPPMHSFLYNMSMEAIGMFVLGLVASLANFAAGPTTNFATGLGVAAAVAGTYLLMAHIYSDYALRRHLNPGLSLVYVGLGEIGIGGLLLYWCAQVTGAIFSGLVLSAILGQQTGSGPADCLTSATCTIQRATVPLPVTANGAYGFGVSQTTVICFQIFIPAIIFLVQVLCEFLNTRIFNKKGQLVQWWLVKNYQHGLKCGALALFVFTAAAYPFQLHGFNGGTYVSGVFSGIVNAPYGRYHSTLAYLPAANFLADSAFNGSAAWALYFFGCLAGGVAAFILSYLVMWSGFKYNSMAKDAEWVRDKVKGTYLSMSPIDEASSPLLVAAQTTHTAVADLVNPYSSKTGIASSVLLK